MSRARAKKKGTRGPCRIGRHHAGEARLNVRVWRRVEAVTRLLVAGYGGDEELARLAAVGEVERQLRGTTPLEVRRGMHQLRELWAWVVRDGQGDESVLPLIEASEERALLLREEAQRTAIRRGLAPPRLVRFLRQERGE